jgi:hypothetical protein
MRVVGCMPLVPGHKTLAHAVMMGLIFAQSVNHQDAED